MKIKITSCLPPDAARRLRRAAKKYCDSDDRYHNGFTHVGIKTYAPLFVEDPHNVARHMMVCAGTTFNYEIK